ncbi:hypothetical protein [Paenibacillus monticola]|uniref:Uncharacterized protein n=1 Tax=Paenibacillus monticola TaxID=2666075 RepID=A0A7X2H2B2_9BACL|nr:hypothetical protein [Paenibacillus monticola]MRN52304.1 hypothetical protein [Paenibacillus monticola]
MDGELHQLLWITASGNGFLMSGADASRKGLEHTDNLEVKFTDGLHSWNWSEWLNYLREVGSRRLMLLGYGVTVVGASEESLWVPDWKLDHHRSRTRWTVTYTKYMISADNKGQREFIPLTELSAKLKDLLQQIGQLSVEIDETFWKDSFFDQGIAILEGLPSAPQLSFDLPSVYSDQAHRLLDAVYKTWVFGGMGSWNDSPPFSAYTHNRKQEYDKISIELYETLLQCARGVVNSVVLT